MKLLIDVGNTRIKWAALAGADLEHVGEARHGNDPDAAAGALIERFHLRPDTVLVANVAGAAFAAALATRIRARWEIEPRFAETQRIAGKIRNGYRDHTTLGVDRWLAILAAADRYRGAAVIVDAGTAITIDLVEADGEHVGGYILPGLDLMRRGLRADTGDLGRLAPPEAGDPIASPVPGRGTAEAIGHGSVAAICALIDHCARRADAHNTESVVVVTGGDAGRIIPHLAVPAEHRPLLVLEGLVLWEPG
jgi:type III pantothenate kinase